MLERAGKRSFERFRGAGFPAASPTWSNQAGVAPKRSYRSLAGGERFGGVWNFPEPSDGAPSRCQVSARSDLRLRDYLARQVRSFDAHRRIICRRVVDSAAASPKSFLIDSSKLKNGDRNDACDAFPHFQSSLLTFNC